MTQCQVCEAPVYKVRYGRLRAPRYCSGSCRQRAYRMRVARSRAEDAAEMETV